MSGLILPDGTPASRLLDEDKTTHREANRLIHETSPYLLQHAHNPVDWFPYTPEAFAEARRKDVPLLLSIGYSACHWCHVMERESFEDVHIAEIMNRNFVCVKIDREELPDVDHLYMTAIQALTGQGGWPLNVFVDHDGKPFFGGTYFPPRTGYNVPTWQQVLEAVSEAWRTQRADVTQTGEQLTVYLNQDAQKWESDGFDAEAIVAHALNGLLETADRQSGGFGSAPKFPQPMLLRFLLETAVGEENLEARKICELTLEKMLYGGIYDQIGGGFARYSTDNRWMVPHFEKMLYDNGQLASLYLHAGIAFRRDDFIRAARETIDWMIRELWLEDETGFASSLDADSDGEEGAYYVWSYAEIMQVLGEADGTWFCDIFQVTEQGNFENCKSILFPEISFAEHAKRQNISDEELLVRHDGLRSKLLEARSKRNRPARDDKILTDWNGLALLAVVAGALYFNDERYRQIALKMADYYAESWKTTGKLAHSRRGTKTLDREYSLDYAAIATGVLDVYRLDGDGKWFEFAYKFSSEIRTKFMTSEDMITISTETIAGIRPVDRFDQALPSANSMSALLWLRLYTLTNEVGLRELVGNVLHSLKEGIMGMPHGFGTALQAVRRWNNPGEQSVFAGKFEELYHAINQQYYPDREFAFVNGALPSGLLELCEGKGTIEGKPALYRCHNRSCLAPITNPSDL